MAEAGEGGTRRTVDIGLHVLVSLEKTGRHRISRWLLDRFSQHRRLGFAPREQHDPTRIKNGADAHRDRVPRNIGLTEKVAGGVTTGEAVERHQPGARIAA